MSVLSGPVYGLQIPAGDIPVPANKDFPASFRITMAAIDPTEEPEVDATGVIPEVTRSTLRILKGSFPGLEGDDDSELDDEELQAMLGDDDSDDEPNGGPSDPSKVEKSKQAAAIKRLIEATQNESDEEDEDMADIKINGLKSKKGKGKAPAQANSDDEDDDDDLDGDNEMEDFVICTLDVQRQFQQPIDITVHEGEEVYFVVTGNHTIYLTGNYIMDDEDEEDEEDDEDFDPREMELALEGMDEDESDELDDVDDPRITEVDSEEEVPKLVETKKGKNKRSAQEEVESLDDLIAKSDETKSKKQQKKLKNNKGEAVATEESKKDKKVQFAKNLEQGPTGSAEKTKQAAKPAIKTVNGVTVDDRTIGKGRIVKNGDTVGVRYIGKLVNGKQFDANKKGKPFSFKVGKGEVIKGWETGVAGMAIGGERRLTIPPDLAYGNKGMPGIPAKSTLVFDIKLLEIK